MVSRPQAVKAGPAARLLALAMLALVCFAPAAVRAPAARAQGDTNKPAAYPYAPENPYGANVFFHKEVEAWKLEETIRLIASANIQWIKQEFPWQEIEFKKGYFQDDKWNKSSWEKFDQIVNLADKYHLRVIARVDRPPEWAKAAPGGTSPIKSNSDLSDFINALLDRYKGRIQYVQVWNEPNLAAEWVPGKAVDPAQYAQMLEDVYPAVKADHPKSVIVSAPMAMTLEGPSLRGNMDELDYWTGLYAAGVKGNLDIVSANGYGLDQPPDAGPDPGKLNFRRVELLHDIMVKNGDTRTPVWFNEFGWNASPDSLSEEEKNYWRHVTPQQQAEWTVAGVEYARKNWPWAGVVCIWYFRQVGDIPPEKAEYYFAMVDPDFKQQPVYDAVKADASNYPGPASSPLPTPENKPPEATPTPTGPEGTPTGAAQASPSVEVTPTGATAQPSATPAVQGAGTGTATLIMYVVGGLLVVGGLVGLGYYFMKGRS